MSAPLIATAGAYADIDAADYHRNPNLLPGPSLSSSGAKTLLSKSPYHFWFDSPLNPNRPPEPDKPSRRYARHRYRKLLRNPSRPSGRTQCADIGRLR